MTYFFLRRALDAGARPRAIIINAKPAVLLAGPEFNARYWQEVLTPRECLEFSLMTRDGPFMLATIVGRLLPSLRSRLEIRSQVLAALRGETDRIPAMNRILLRNWTVNGGANVAAAHPERQDDAEPEIERRLHPGLFFVDPTNAAGNGTALATGRCARHPGLLAAAPVVAGPSRPCATRAAPRPATNSSSGHSSTRYPRLLTVLDARRGDYPASLFTDHTHLNGQGALALSRAVAQAIRPLLARPRSRAGSRLDRARTPRRSSRGVRRRRRGPRAIAEGPSRG